MAHHRATFVELATGRARPIGDAPLVWSSASAGWEGFVVEEHPAQEVELKDVASTSHILSVQIDGPMTVDWRGDGRVVQKTVAPGQLCLVPATLPFSGHFRNSGRVTVVALEQKFLSCAAAELGGLRAIEPKCLHGFDDPLLREMVLGLRAEGQSENPEGRLYAELLATAVAARLLHRYAVKRGAAPERLGGLTKPRLRRVIEFIHAGLGDDLSLVHMAGVVELSPFHFARLFKQSTGFSPHEYVTRCRVERARELLLHKHASLSEVARQVGFCDQSHLARHFRRFTGMTPAAYARSLLPKAETA